MCGIETTKRRRLQRPRSKHFEGPALGVALGVTLGVALGARRVEQRRPELEVLRARPRHVGEVLRLRSGLQERGLEQRERGCGATIEDLPPPIGRDLYCFVSRGFSSRALCSIWKSGGVSERHGPHLIDVAVVGRRRHDRSNIQRNLNGFQKATVGWRRQRRHCRAHSARAARAPTPNDDLVETNVEASDHREFKRFTQRPWDFKRPSIVTKKRRLWKLETEILECGKNEANATTAVETQSARGRDVGCGAQRARERERCGFG